MLNSDQFAALGRIPIQQDNSGKVKGTVEVLGWAKNGTAAILPTLGVSFPDLVSFLDTLKALYFWFGTVSPTGTISKCQFVVACSDNALKNVLHWYILTEDPLTTAQTAEIARTLKLGPVNIASGVYRLY